MGGNPFAARLTTDTTQTITRPIVRHDVHAPYSTNDLVNGVFERSPRIARGKIRGHQRTSSNAYRASSRIARDLPMLFIIFITAVFALGPVLILGGMYLWDRQRSKTVTVEPWPEHTPDSALAPARKHHDIEPLSREQMEKGWTPTRTRSSTVLVGLALCFFGMGVNDWFFPKGPPSRTLLRLIFDAAHPYFGAQSMAVACWICAGALVAISLVARQSND
ncbi:hypothetical protein O4G98_13085 [Zoogloeaceae bacterium G21618-S1]|nr:hypothetical protein [Zoogloeaceae bacterium G21618-S1]